MGIVGGTFGDPLFQGVFVFFGEDFFGVRGWHLLVFVGGEEAGDDLAGFGFAGDDGEGAGFATGERGVAEVEAEFAFAAVVVHAVAGEALLGEDGADFAVEVDGRRGGGEQEGDEEDAVHESGSERRTLRGRGFCR